MATSVLNSDVLFEILSRLDLKTMRKCRILSKECNAMTYTSSFIRTHCERTNTLCGYISHVSTETRSFWKFSSIDNPGSGVHPNSIEFNFLRLRSLRILAGVDIGLFFCGSSNIYFGERYFVCKPTTLQWDIIPIPTSRDSSQRSSYFMMVLKSNPLKFKILRLQPHGLCNFRCEIFDSDIWSWKQLDDLNIPDSQFLPDYRRAISVCGRLYWIYKLIRDEYKILSFDQDEENWELNLVPDSCKNHEMKLAVYGGNVALVCKRRDADMVEVWVLSYSDGAKCWNKLQTLLNLENLMHPGLVSFSQAADTFLIWGSCIDDRPIFCNFKNGYAPGIIKDFSEMVDDFSLYFLQTDYEPVAGLLTLTPF